MKPIGVISKAVLLLVLGAYAPTYAQQQDQQDKDKQKQQRDQNREHERAQQQQEQNKQRDQNREERAQQDRNRQQDQNRERQREGQQQEQNRQQQRAQQQQVQNGEQRGQKQQRQQDANERSRSNQEREVEQRDAWQQRRARTWHSEHRTWQQRGGYSGYRIPDDRFRGSFGQNHGFRIYSQPVVVVDGYPRFQYGGYWFSLVDPWPEYWSDDWYDRDDVYIEYFGDGYYLYNRRYPGDRIAVSVYMN